MINNQKKIPVLTRREKMRKPRKTCHESRSPDRDLNTGRPVYNAAELATRP